MASAACDRSGQARPGRGGADAEVPQSQLAVPDDAGSIVHSPPLDTWTHSTGNPADSEKDKTIKRLEQQLAGTEAKLAQALQAGELLPDVEQYAKYLRNGLQVPIYSAQPDEHDPPDEPSSTSPSPTPHAKHTLPPDPASQPPRKKGGSYAKSATAPTGVNFLAGVLAADQGQFLPSRLQHALGLIEVLLQLFEAEVEQMLTQEKKKASTRPKKSPAPLPKTDLGSLAELNRNMSLLKDKEAGKIPERGGIRKIHHQLHQSAALHATQIAALGTDDAGVHGHFWTMESEVPMGGKLFPKAIIMDEVSGNLLKTHAVSAQGLPGVPAPHLSPYYSLVATELKSTSVLLCEKLLEHLKHAPDGVALNYASGDATELLWNQAKYCFKGEFAILLNLSASHRFEHREDGYNPFRIMIFYNGTNMHFLVKIAASDTDGPTESDPKRQPESIVYMSDALPADDPHALQVLVAAYLACMPKQPPLVLQQYLDQLSKPQLSDAERKARGPWGEAQQRKKNGKDDAAGGNAGDGDDAAGGGSTGDELPQSGEGDGNGGGNGGAGSTSGRAGSGSARDGMLSASLCSTQDRSKWQDWQDNFHNTRVQQTKEVMDEELSKKRDFAPKAFYSLCIDTPQRRPFCGVFAILESTRPQRSKGQGLRPSNESAKSDGSGTSGSFLSGKGSEHTMRSLSSASTTVPCVPLARSSVMSLDDDAPQTTRARSSPGADPPPLNGFVDLEHVLGTGQTGAVFPLHLDGTIFARDRPLCVKIEAITCRSGLSRSLALHDAQVRSHLRRKGVAGVGEAIGIFIVRGRVPNLLVGLVLEQVGAELSSWADLSDSQVTSLNAVVAALHHAGVAHKDLAPHNVRLIDGNTVEPIDFGQAIMGLSPDSGVVEREMKQLRNELERDRHAYV